MKTKFQKIPGIMFASFLLLLFFVWLGSFLDFKSSLENLIPTLEFNAQKALASENDIEEAQDEDLWTDTMYVEDNSAYPGSTVWISFGTENDSFKIGGITFTITYDTNIIIPDFVIFIDTDTFVIIDTTTTPPETTITVVVDTNWAIPDQRTERTDTLTFMMWWPAPWGFHLDTTRFVAAIYPDTLNPPIDTGRGPIVRLRFIVNPDAEPGTTTTINFIPDRYIGAQLANAWDDSAFTGTVYIPRLKSGTFTVRGEPTENQPPVFDPSMPSYFEVNEGATLEFGVKATDEDMGDIIHLYMDPLDAQYQDNYTFRDTSAADSVTQTFTFEPDFGQGPATVWVTFKADDSQDVTEKVVRIEIIETAQDILIATSEQGGIPGSSGRMVPFIITNSIPIYGFQFTLRWDHTMVDIDSFVPTDVIEEFSLGENLEDSSGVVTVLVFGLAGQTIPAGIETVLYAAFSVEEDAPSGEVPLQLENAREAVNPGYPSQPLGMVHGKFTIDLFGDANVDRVVDIADVVSVVAYILGNIDFTSRQFLAADVVPDSSVNVFDLGAIINIILGRWTGPSPSPYSDSEPPAIVRLDYEDLQPGATGEVKVMADLEVPVAGAQIQISYDPEQLSFEAPRLSDWSDKFIAEYKDDMQGKLIVLLYNLSNDPISPGEGNMLSLPVTVSPNIMNKIKLEIDEILLADENAVRIPVDDGKPSVPQAFELCQNYPNPFNPNTTIKYTLPSVGEGEESLPTTLKIYNILGEVVRTLVNEPKSSGVHYEVWDGKDDRGDQVASGIYFYRLKAGKFSETKKMVLLK